MAFYLIKQRYSEYIQLHKQPGGGKLQNETSRVQQHIFEKLEGGGGRIHKIPGSTIQYTLSITLSKHTDTCEYLSVGDERHIPSRSWQNPPDAPQQRASQQVRPGGVKQLRQVLVARDHIIVHQPHKVCWRRQSHLRGKEQYRSDSGKRHVTKGNKCARLF